MNDDTFKVGEIAVFQNLPVPFDFLNDKETEIRSALCNMCVVDVFGTYAIKMAYRVFADGREVACEAANLKKKVKKAVAIRELELEAA